LELHDYIYVKNNPVNFIDPLGLTTGAAVRCESLPLDLMARALRAVEKDCNQQGKRYKAGTCFAIKGRWGWIVVGECEDKKEDCDKCKKQYDEKVGGQQFEEISRAKSKKPKEIECIKKSKQNDKNWLNNKK
jgi:hypothetical protein